MPFLVSRSLFVPYFKHLLGNCVHHLNDGGNTEVSSLSRKKKKAKVLDDGNVQETGTLPIKSWHLRTLVLSSLHKCFLYDTGSLKFLNSSNIQASELFTLISYHLYSQYGVVLKNFLRMIDFKSYRDWPIPFKVAH